MGTAVTAQYEHLIHKTHAERLQVLSIFYNDTIPRFDSVYTWKRIGVLTQLARDSSDDDLLMETDLMRMVYFARHSKYPPSFITSKIEEAKTSAIRQHKVWAQTVAENTESSYYYGQRYYELSFEHSQRLYELVKDINPEEFPYKQLCLMNIGTRYFMFGEYRQSLFYFLHALQCEPKFMLYKKPLRLNLLNTTGMDYQKLGDIDSSDFYFNATYQLAAAIHDTAFQGIASGNLGYNLYLGKKYDAAIPLLQKDVDIALYRKDWGLASGSLMALGDISLAKGDYTLARQQLEQAKEFIFRSRQMQRLEDVYPLLAKLYISKHEPALATMYMDSSFYWKDSTAKRFSGQQILRAKQKIALDQVNTEMERANDKRKMYEAQRNTLIMFVLVIMGGGLYFYRLRARKNMLQATLLQKTEQELVTATRQLDDFTRYISEKNEIIEYLELQNNLANNETLEKLHKSTILTDDDWEYYKELFEKAHPGFFDRLKEKMPGLTPAETRFMALSKLNLSGKEMAKILGVGTDAIRQYRSRVRKKMQLGDDDNLNELTLNI